MRTKPAKGTRAGTYYHASSITKSARQEGSSASGDEGRRTLVDQKSARLTMKVTTRAR